MAEKHSIFSCVIRLHKTTPAMMPTLSATSIPMIVFIKTLVGFWYRLRDLKLRVEFCHRPRR